MLRLSSYLILACLPLRLIAETAQDPLIGLEEGMLDDMPVVLSATQLAQPLNESPVAMTVIDREMIDASGTRTIPELLLLVPGFQPGYFDGNSPVVTYRGLADEYSRRIQVLIDGRSVYVPALAAIQWSDLVICIDEIERIEVTRGPSAKAYGNNSFLGVISITTRHAIEDHGQKVTIRAGIHDTADAMYHFGGRNESTDYRFTLCTHNNDGTGLLNDYSHGRNKLKLALAIQNFLGDYYDYSKTRYIDASQTTIATDSDISAYGSLQDMRSSLEISYLFNKQPQRHNATDRKSNCLN